MNHDIAGLNQPDIFCFEQQVTSVRLIFIFAQTIQRIHEVCLNTKLFKISYLVNLRRKYVFSMKDKKIYVQVNRNMGVLYLNHLLCNLSKAS